MFTAFTQRYDTTSESSTQCSKQPLKLTGIGELHKIYLQSITLIAEGEATGIIILKHQRKTNGK